MDNRKLSRRYIHQQPKRYYRIKKSCKSTIINNEQIKDFQHKVRKHNQMIRHGIDPQWKDNKQLIEWGIE